jgi:hypothetical protein
MPIAGREGILDDSGREVPADMTRRTGGYRPLRKKVGEGVRYDIMSWAMLQVEERGERGEGM